jgi:two-component system KDP operon response regulator KdpE
MPGLNGFEVCRRIRQWSQVPIIFLSARGEEESKIKALSGGADDYLCKPFSTDELKARIDAVLRRSGSPDATISSGPFVNGGLCVYFAERRATMDGHDVKLTRFEYNLLQELALNVNKVLTHSHLLAKVWGLEYGLETEYLRVFINRLRRKLGQKPGKECMIITIPGVGYELRREPSKSPDVPTTN